MNDHPLNDPQLQSFEARLAAMVPQVSPVEQQQLLCECAFAAGQSKAGRSSRRWRTVAAALGLLLLAVSVPFTRDRLLIAKRTPEPIVPAEGTPSRLPAPLEPAAVARQSAAVELDAWQMPPSPGVSLAEQLAQLERMDAHLRPLAVGTLTRAVLQP